MKPLKSSTYVLFLVVLLLLASSVSTGIARAASIFDDIVTLGKPEATCGGEIYDLNSSYADILAGNDSTFDSYMNAALAVGKGWSLVQDASDTGGGNIQYSLSVYVSVIPAATSANFTSTYNNWNYLALNSSIRGSIGCAGMQGGEPVWTTDFNTAGANREIAFNSGSGVGRFPIFVNASVNYPAGYEGVVVPLAYAHPPVRYVALGDSFSSGEGNSLFEAGTNTAINKCHRSSHAYPRLLRDSQGLSPMSFVACSGATIDDVLGNSESDDPIGKWGESKQIDALTDDTEVVTITIGGNDVGFKTFATNCALATCAVNSQPYNNIMDEIDINFQDKLEGLYRTILAESGDGEVYVLGYPLLVGDSSGNDCQTFEIVSDIGARAVTNALNSRISAAVDAVRNDPNNVSYTGRLTYVPANSDNSTSPFDGKYICSTPPYFNGIDILHQEYSFHPNSAGHLAYKTIMEAALN